MKKSMKINRSILPVFAITALLAASDSFAQVNPGSSGTGNQSGNVGSAPAGINIDFTKLGVWMITRLHTVDLDGAIVKMSQSGVSKKDYVAGFSAEGALVYNYELSGEELKDWNDIGRNAGIQLIPYSLELMPDGRKQVSFSTLAWKNMNAVQNSKHYFGDNHGYDGYYFFKIVDQLDLFSFSWDQNMTFNNVRSFDFNVVNLNLRAAVAKSEDKKSYIAFRAGGNFGGSKIKIDHLENDGYSNLNRMGPKGQFHAGLETNFQTKKDIKINLQSNYVSGRSQVFVKNQSITQYNIDGANAYNQAMDQYNTGISNYAINLDAWRINKAAYEQNSLGGTVISEESYIALTGNQKPIAPNEPTKFSAEKDDQKMMRTFAHIRTSAEVSFPLKKSGTPMRLGLGMSYNVVIYDRIKNDKSYSSASNIDLKPNFNQNITGRIFLNF